MNRDHIPSISDPSSPWYALSEMRKPNVKWCEGQNNGWIIEPANTWSNLSFIVLAILLFRKSRSLLSRDLKAYAPAFLALGFCSGIYHASFTFLFQILDFFGMYLVTYLMLLINFNRQHLVKNAVGAIYWACVLGTTASTALLDLYTSFPIQILILAQVLVLLISEFILWQTKNQHYSMKYFWLGFALILVAGTFSSLDVTRRWCDPENHLLQGHAIWHVFSSLALFCFFLHQKQFDRDLAN